MSRIQLIGLGTLFTARPTLDETGRAYASGVGSGYRTKGDLICRC